MIVDFETKCWEEDWEYILKTNRLEKMIDLNDYKFSKKRLIINNVEDKSEVEKYANKKIAKNIIDEYINVKDYEDEVLNYFEISESFKLDEGYKYSISELTGIYISQADFLVHYSSDSILIKKKNWIDYAIEIYHSHDNIKVVSPVEGRKEKEKIDKHHNGIYLTNIFSDQCYIINVNDFKKKIYSEKNDDLNIYPIYGGNLFEKRVHNYLRVHNFSRALISETIYYSMNFKKLKLFKKMIIIFQKDLSYLFSIFVDIKRFFKSK